MIFSRKSRNFSHWMDRITQRPFGRFFCWRSFLNMLAYKADLYGRQFVTISPRNTTQTCHNCGFVMGTNGTDKLTLADRKWACPKCDIHHIRDWNAAKNILDKGIAKLA